MNDAEFRPTDPDYRSRVESSFSRQAVMNTLGIELMDLGPGWTEMRLTRTKAVAQQHGFIHAGVLATALDSACGYAAMSLFPSDQDVVTVEFKVNLLSPAIAPELQVSGRVIRPGRTITVAQATARAGHAGEAVAVMTATLMRFRDRHESAT